jgi:hypothetical protein
MQAVEASWPQQLEQAKGPKSPLQGQGFLPECGGQVRLALPLSGLKMQERRTIGEVKIVPMLQTTEPISPEDFAGHRRQPASIGMSVYREA